MKTNRAVRILTLILIPTIGFLLGHYLMYRLHNTIVFESSLVSTHTENSEYLRPKTWKRTTQGSLEFYSDWPLYSKDPRAKMIIVDKGERNPLVDIFLRDNSVDSWRDAAYEDVDKSLSKLQSSSDTTCNDFSNTQVTRGTSDRHGIHDLLIITADCKNGSKEYVYYWRTTIDDSQNIRLVAFISEKWLWERNEKIFLKMVDSVGPIHVDDVV